MAEANHYRHSVVKGLMQKFEDDSLAPSFMSIGATVIEFKEKKKKNNMDKIGKICLALIGRGSGILVKYFIHSFVLTCSILYSRIDLKLKVRT